MRAAVAAVALSTWAVTSPAQSPQALVRGRVINEQTLGVPLTRIGHVALGPNGAVAISYGQGLAIVRGAAKPLLFSRAGEGPGELRSISGMGWRGDTLWVGDEKLMRVTLFSSAGKLVRSIPVQVDGSPVLLRDGAVAVVPSIFARVAAQPAEVRKIRRAAGGKLTGTLVAETFGYRAFSLKTLRGTIVGQQPYDDFPLWRQFPDGSGFAVVQRPAGGRPVFTVRRISETGKLIFARSYPYPPILLSEQDASAQWARLISAMPNHDDPALKRAARDALYRPARHPTISALVTGADGSIWLARERTGAATVRWTLLNAKGEIVGDYLAPVGFFALAGTATSLWGEVRDAGDVPSVVELRVPGKK